MFLMLFSQKQIVLGAAQQARRSGRGAAGAAFKGRCALVGRFFCAYLENLAIFGRVGPSCGVSFKGRCALVGRVFALTLKTSRFSAELDRAVQRPQGREQTRIVHVPYKGIDDRDKDKRQTRIVPCLTQIWPLHRFYFGVFGAHWAVKTRQGSKWSPKA